jgi:hypothetical protein
VWLDSQDLAGVAAAVRKQLSVYLIGVQREENEVKRVLAHISGATKPSRDAIMSLDIGHMFACWRGHAHHVYVQPKWMNETDGTQRRDGHAADAVAAQGGTAATTFRNHRGGRNGSDRKSQRSPRELASS